MDWSRKKLEIKELESYIIVLQRAIQNEHNDMEFVDISNFLDMVLDKIDYIMKIDV